jgi:hypothetical protein
MSEQIRIDLQAADVDTAQLDELTRALREELLQLDVDDVTSVSAGPAPPGSKAVELAVIGSLIVTLKGTAELAEKVMSVVRSWLNRGAAADADVEVTIGDHTIKLSGASKEQQDALVAEFVRAARASS